MVDELPGDLPDVAVASDAGQHSLIRKWVQTNRYVNVMVGLADRDSEPACCDGRPRLPPKRISQDDKDALLTAGLALLIIAGAAFLAGLL